MNTVLIANRGEIAVRIARTCRDLGLTAVAVHSSVDAGALHVRVADRAVALDGATAAETYLDEAKILAAAREAGADAIHPGYGFLSENARFADAVAAAGLTFIGPPAAAITAMGDKVVARRTAAAAGVHGVPGTLDPLTGTAEVRAFADEHGYPLALKASAGGGGRGMRVVAGPDEIERAFAAAQREAAAAFGDDTLYVERYLQAPRHVEVQVLADAHGKCVALGDRDCSIQRRHQKLIEEAPAPGLEPAVRAAMAQAAVAVAAAVDYVGAGTIEFLYEAGEFFFLEMNTRLQVEHTVTETVLGLDLVAEQLRVARGERIRFAPDELQARGHAIECRINAEDPASGRFLPSAGRIARITAPHGPGLRFDGGYESGDEVSDLYDNLVGKLVAWAPDRETARRRALRALTELTVEGVATNVPALEIVLAHPDFAAVQHTTSWLEHHADLLPAAAPLPAAPGQDGAVVDDDANVVFVGGRTYHLGAPDVPTAVAAQRERSRPSAGRRAAGPRPPRGASANGAAVAERRPAAASAGPGRVLAQMQGRVLAVHVAVGEAVAAGQVVCVMEAMKMENEIVAEIAGTVAEVAVAAGDGVAPGALLLRVEAQAPTGGAT